MPCFRDWLQDARVALRTFARAPGFAAAAVLSIGIGVGANTAIFSVTNALLVRPLPYPDPGRLAIVWNRSPGLNITEDWFSTAQYFDIRDPSLGPGGRRDRDRVLHDALGRRAGARTHRRRQAVVEPVDDDGRDDGTRSRARRERRRAWSA